MKKKIKIFSILICFLFISSTIIAGSSIEEIDINNSSSNDTNNIPPDDTTLKTSGLDDYYDTGGRDNDRPQDGPYLWDKKGIWITNLKQKDEDYYRIWGDILNKHATRIISYGSVDHLIPIIIG